MCNLTKLCIQIYDFKINIEKKKNRNSQKILFWVEGSALPDIWLYYLANNN